MKKKYILVFLMGLLLAGIFIFLGKSKSFQTCDNASKYEFAKVKVGDVKLNIPVDIAKLIDIKKYKGASGKGLLLRIKNKVKCPQIEFIEAKHLEISYYGMTALDKAEPSYLPKGLEYLMIYDQPVFESYLSYPEEESNSIGVSHYRCEEQACRIYMKHSVLPLYFEFRVKVTELFLGRPNPKNTWYPKPNWPELVKEIDDALTSMSVLER